jgi:hypothetical protein
MNFFSRSKPAYPDGHPEVEFIEPSGYTGDAWMTPVPNQEALLQHYSDDLKIGDKVTFLPHAPQHGGMPALVLWFHRGENRPGHEQDFCNVYNLQTQTMLFDVPPHVLAKKSEYAECFQDSRTGTWSWHEPIGDKTKKRARGRYATDKPF